MRWARHVACTEEDTGVHRVLVRKPEGKRPLGRPRRRWEDNIKIDLQEVGGARGDYVVGRSEERRVRKECGSSCRSRWPPNH
jgi:hypothetical protein